MHHLHKALVLVTQAVAHRHAHVLEEDGAAADGALAVAIEAVGAQARGVHGHQYGGHAVRARLGCAGAAKHDGNVGLVGGGNGSLLAVDDVEVAVALNAQAQIGSVRSAARLGQGNRANGFAGAEFLEPGRDHFRIAVLGQDLTVE